MSLTVSIRLDDARVRAGFEKAPGALMRHISRNLHRGALEVSREARKNSPKAFSTLTHSITVERETPFRYRVGSGVDYAPMVEDGAGSGGRPPRQSLLDWIRIKRITPNDPEVSADDLAYVIGRTIARKGTPAQPYLAPALESKRSRLLQLVEQGAEAGLREAGL